MTPRRSPLPPRPEVAVAAAAGPGAAPAHPTGTAVEASPSRAPSTGELIGWVQAPRGRISRARSREALATGLGVSPAELEGLTADTVRRGLERLRSIADELVRLTAAAERDDLTGASRRGAGLEQLSREVSRCRRLGQPLSVAFLDVDGLKVVNDELGHPAGDRLLREVVATLRERLRAYDLVTRYGGDEFVVVLPGTGEDAAARLLAAINDQLMERTAGRGVSIGVAELAPGESAADLLARADQVLVDRRQRLRARAASRRR